MVKLPFNEKKESLGDSRKRSLHCLNSLVKRFEKSPDLEKDYIEFLDEDETLNHMTELKGKNLNEPKFYFPHHPVFRHDSLTTKIRVVFNASSLSDSGLSLNDTFLTGPALQCDILSLLLRFRSHKYALTADIDKMYRQSLVHPDDTPYQNILFRKNFQEPVKVFSLKTVTYGTSCAPYLAIRVLQQLAEDEKITHPLAASILKNDFYVDDLLTGWETLEEAKVIREELMILLKKEVSLFENGHQMRLLSLSIIEKKLKPHTCR